jgi:hypothetical protein
LDSALIEVIALPPLNSTTMAPGAPGAEARLTMAKPDGGGGGGGGGSSMLAPPHEASNTAGVIPTKNRKTIRPFIASLQFPLGQSIFANPAQGSIQELLHVGAQRYPGIIQQLQEVREIEVPVVVPSTVKSRPFGFGHRPGPE